LKENLSPHPEPALPMSSPPVRLFEFAPALAARFCALKLAAIESMDVSSTMPPTMMQDRRAWICRGGDTVSDPFARLEKKPACLVEMEYQIQFAHILEASV
jgi:hypothetical protein